MRTLPVALLLAALSLTPSVQAATYAELYRATVEAFNAEDYDRALALQTEALVLRPGFPGVLENLALIQTRRSEHDDAIARLQELAAMGYQLSLPLALYQPLAEHPGWEPLMAQLEANAQPQGEATTFYQGSFGAWVPEGIAYDPALGTLYLGSVRHGVIVAIDGDGESETLLGPEAGLWAVFGMEVDRRTRMLWVATSHLRPEYAGPNEEDPGAAAIVSVDPYSASVVSRFVLPADGAAVLGDLTLGEDGTVYTTDSLGGVHALEPRSGAWRTLLPAGVMTSPQGLALSGDEALLYVADYRGGITVIPLDGADPYPLAMPEGAGAYGIDGMEFWNGRLLVVINGSRPHRVLELELTADGSAVTEARSLLRADPRFDEPTLTAVQDGHLLLIADSHWNRFDREGNLPPDEELSGPTVLAVPLSH